MVPVILFSLVSLITHVSAGGTCPKCGNLEVPYPLSTSENCGDPRYRVFCTNDILQFKSARGFYYNISSIDPSEFKLVIRPPSIPKNTCQSSDLGFGGLMLDKNLPFNISNHNTVLLFNCSENVLLSPMNCTSRSICRQFEAMSEEGIGCRGTLCCHFLKDASMTSHRIRLRVGGCTAYTSVVNIKLGDAISSWNYGIELQWMPPK